jgi:hypothetical protein
MTPELMPPTTDPALNSTRCWRRSSPFVTYAERIGAAVGAGWPAWCLIQFVPTVLPRLALTASNVAHCTRFSERLLEASRAISPLRRPATGWRVADRRARQSHARTRARCRRGAGARSGAPGSRKGLLSDGSGKSEVHVSRSAIRCIEAGLLP